MPFEKSKQLQKSFCPGSDGFQEKAVIYVCETQ
jgi:hypothetical protein